ncbi:TPA: hypothetical protein ACX6RO_001779 [Photobacterium damselae]
MAYKFTLDTTNPYEHITRTFGDIPRIPSYTFEERKVGLWHLKPFKCGEVAGWWSSFSDQATFNNGNNIALIRDSVTVMSVTPLETESHLLPNYAARGNVVIAGLGLGMITINLLKKKVVTKITVLEIDEAVISLYPNVLSGADKQLWLDSIASGRLTVIKHDCLKPISKETKTRIGNVDYMWVDIWNVIGDKDALSITQFIQSQIKAKAVDFWTQEFIWLSDIISVPLFHEKPLKVFRKWLDDTNLPLTARTETTNKQRLLLDLSLVVAGLQTREQQAKQKRAAYFLSNR